MHESFGARLRHHRQEQGIALGTIAEQSKIKGSLLEALERDDVSQWPSGIYRRAYIRAYAHAIGLDPDVVLREFLERYPDQAEVDAAAAIATLAENARTHGGPPTRLRYLVGSAIGSLARLTRGTPSHVHQHPVERTAPTTETRVDADVRIPSVDQPLYEERPLESQRAAAVEEPARLQYVDGLVAQWPNPEAGTDVPHQVVAAEQASATPEPAAIAGVTHQAVAAPAGDPPVTDVRLLRRRKDDLIPGPGFQTIAQLCTQFARVGSTDDLQCLLKESARLLDASGLIVWVWDIQSGLLQAALAHGYSERMLAQLPGVRRDADNPTAAAFRTAEMKTIPAGDGINGALVVPLMTPDGCAGVLALELRNGGEQATTTRGAATIMGAMLAQLVGPVRAAESEPQIEVDPTFENFAASIRREHARR